MPRHDACQKKQPKQFQKTMSNPGVTSLGTNGRKDERAKGQKSSSSKGKKIERQTVERTKGRNDKMSTEGQKNKRSKG